MATARVRLNIDKSRELLEEKRALALRRWFVALANRNTAPADIMTITDSIGEGHRLTSYLGRMTAVMLNRLRASFPTTGVTGGNGYIADHMALISSGGSQCADWPTVGTGGTTPSTAGLGMRCRFWQSAGNTVYTFTGATSIGIRYSKNGSSGAVGTFTWKIDAGGTTTVDCKTDPAGDMSEELIAIPDTGAHTVTVAWATGAVVFDGFMHYNGDETKGIRMWEGGHSTAATSIFATGSALTNLGKHCAQIQPSLVIIELFANDFLGTLPVSAASARANLDLIVTSIKANVTIDPSIVLVPVWELGNVAITPIDPWTTFVANLYAKAASDPDICIWDAQKRTKTVIGSGDNCKGILRGDEGTYPAHPSDLGAVYLGEGLARFMMPR
jgi:hypothetical protein